MSGIRTLNNTVLNAPIVFLYYPINRFITVLSTYLSVDEIGIES